MILQNAEKYRGNKKRENQKLLQQRDDLTRYILDANALQTRITVDSVRLITLVIPDWPSPSISDPLYLLSQAGNAKLHTDDVCTTYLDLSSFLPLLLSVCFPFSLSRAGSCLPCRIAIFHRYYLWNHTHTRAHTEKTRALQMVDICYAVASFGRRLVHQQRYRISQMRDLNTR